MKQRIIAYLALLITLSACTSANSFASPTISPPHLFTPTNKREPTFTPSLLPAFAQTAVPTQTPAPTKTPRPTATVTEPSVPLLVPPAGITYQTDKGLYMTEDLGKATLLFEHSEYDWVTFSPDRLWALAYDFSRPVQLLINLENGENAIIWPREEHNLCPFSWVKKPQPLTLISVLLPGDSDPGYSCNRGSPVLLSLSGEMTVFDESGSGYSAPDVSADGEWIAYDLGGIPWLFNWQDGVKPFDAVSFGFPIKEKVAFSDPKWSSSAKKIAWTYWTYDNLSEETAKSGIAIFDLETQTSYLLQPYDVTEYEGSRTRIEWSADETYISVWHFDRTLPNFSWEIISIDGVLTQRLEGQFGEWSPVGQLFTVAKTDGNSWEYYVESVNGSVNYPLCCKIHESLWSPDGKELLLKSGTDTYWLMEIKSGAKVQVNLPPGARLLSWDAKE
jgi:hypothetical protein